MPELNGFVNHIIPSREEGKNPKPPDENPPDRCHARRMSMRILLLAAALAFAAGASAQPASDAKNWPSRAIHMIVPFRPGSSPDLIARVLSEKLAPAFGTPVIVENRPGAGGNLGTALVARAAPDGYTIGISIPGQVAAGCVVPATAMPLVQSGRLKALAVTTSVRSIVLPEYPTLAEAGYPEVVSTAWNGIVAPAKTPRPIVERLAGGLVAFLGEEEGGEKLLG